MNALPALRPSAAVVPHEQTFSPRQISLLIGISIRAVNIRIKRDGITPTGSVVARGGEQQQYALKTLPEKWRSKILRKVRGNAEGQQPIATTAKDDTRILEMPEWKRTEVSCWLHILKECEGRNVEGTRRRLVELEAENPGVEMSLQTYYRKRKAFQEEGVEGLAPAWGWKRKSSALPWFNTFAQYWLVEGGPDLLAAHRATFGSAVRENPALKFGEFPSHMAFKRLMDTAIPPDTQNFYRKGEEWWTRNGGKSHIQRDPSKVGVGEFWVSDHHQLDVGCKWETVLSWIPTMDGESMTKLTDFIRDKKGNAKTVFPWITVWQDFRTGKILSCLFHDDAPNSDHIIYSFYLACQRYGVPQSILIDNGKDYRSIAFSGARSLHKKVLVGKSEVQSKAFQMRLDERARSICRLLGVKVHFAIPYNAKTKPIERAFRKFKEWLCRFLPGYRGGHHKERPEKLEAEIKSGALFSNEELCAAVQTFIELVFNRFPSQGKFLKGKSPDEFWDTHEKATRPVAGDELALCCMKATEARKIDGSGCTYSKLKLSYYADWMSTQSGRKVYMRIDLMNFQTAFVFDAKDDRFLGRAQANYWQADALVKDKAGSERLGALQRLQGQQLKDIKQIGRELDLGVEHLDIIGDTAAALAQMGTERGYTPGAPLMIERTAGHTAMAAVVIEDREAEARRKDKPFDIERLVQDKPRRKKFHLLDCDREIEEASVPANSREEQKRAVG